MDREAGKEKKHVILVLISPLWHFFHRFVKQNKTSDSNSLPGGNKSASEKQRQKRGSWGGSACQIADLVLLNDFLMYILLLYYFTISGSLLVLFFPSITIDPSNIHGLVSRKESHMSVKSSSSVELGSLYRQIEVSAFVTVGCGAGAGLWESNVNYNVNSFLITEAHMNDKT